MTLTMSSTLTRSGPCTSAFTPLSLPPHPRLSLRAIKSALETGTRDSFSYSCKAQRGWSLGLSVLRCESPARVLTSRSGVTRYLDRPRHPHPAPGEDFNIVMIGAVRRPILLEGAFVRD